MAADKLKYASGNSASTTLSTSMTNTDTTTPLTSSTNFDDAPTAGAGVVLIDEGTASEELAYSTGISGASLTTPLANRGIEGGSAQGHDAGASVRGIFTAGMWNDVIDSLKNLVLATTGAVDTTKIVDVPSAQTISGAKTFSAAPLFTFGTEANGDIFYGNGSGQLQRLPVGSNGTILTLAAGVPSWATPATVSVDGWTSVSDSWSYASASTITVPSGAASLYKKGDKIKFTQTSVKYFVIVAVADTLLTVAVNTDYTVANAAISAISYSHQENPIGFPEKFNFTSTVTSGTGTLTTVNGSTSYYYIIGSFCYLMVNILITTNGTGATDIRATFPIPTTDTSQGGYGSSPSLIPLMVAFNSTTQLNIRKYDGTYPGADGRYLGATVIYKY
jgi:hypothetical protein